MKLDVSGTSFPLINLVECILQSLLNGVTDRTSPPRLDTSESTLPLLPPASVFPSPLSSAPYSLWRFLRPHCLPPRGRH